MVIESTSSRTFALQAIAVKALKLAGTTSAKTLCHRMVQLGLTFEKSEEQGRLLYSHQELNKATHLLLSSGLSPHPEYMC